MRDPRYFDPYPPILPPSFHVPGTPITIGFDPPTVIIGTKPIQVQVPIRAPGRTVIQGGDPSGPSFTLPIARPGQTTGHLPIGSGGRYGSIDYPIFDPPGGTVHLNSPPWHFAPGWGLTGSIGLGGGRPDPGLQLGYTWPPKKTK